MRPRILTLDANVFIAVLKADEKYSKECADILRKLPGKFVLAERFFPHGTSRWFSILLIP